VALTQIDKLSTAIQASARNRHERCIARIANGLPVLLRNLGGTQNAPTELFFSVHLY
jgi:hypothetical protein